MLGKINFKEAGAKVIGLTAGAAGARFLDRVIPATLPPLAKGGIKILAGVLMPGLLGKKSKGIIAHIGDGMIAEGAVQVAASMVPQLFGAAPAQVKGLGMSDEQGMHMLGDASYLDTAGAALSGAPDANQYLGTPNPNRFIGSDEADMEMAAMNL